MKTKTPLLLPLLALPLLAFSGREDKVSFQPSAGARVSKELGLTATFYLDDMRMVIDGNEMPQEMMGQAMEQGLLIDMTVGCTDEYAKSDENKPLQLMRTYDVLAMEAGPESEAESVDDFAEMEDMTVSFTWDEESGEYLKAFVGDEEGDLALLENLEVDMDFLALLPTGEVSEGDTWEAKGDAVGAVFIPGGMPGGGDMDEADMEEFQSLIEETVESQLTEAFDEFAIQCTYKGVRDEDGVAVGVIEFRFEGDMEMDLSDMLQEVISMQAGEADISATVSAVVMGEFEGEGLLLWNMKAGHMHGFEMEGDVMITVDVEGDVDAMGESHSMELSMEASGELDYEMTTSAE
jgi:hypothetical protein